MRLDCLALFGFRGYNTNHLLTDVAMEIKAST
jgi:hypothetical protein